MRFPFGSLVVLVVISLVFSCTEQSTEEKPLVQTQDVIVLRPGPDVVMSSTGNEVSYNQGIVSPASRAKVELPQDYVTHGVIDFNLDKDDDLEQIVVIKKQGDVRDLIHLAIIDFVQDSKSWVLSWEGQSLATNLATFDVRVVDVLGRHEQTIVAHGITKEGHQTLSLFHPRETPGGLSPIVLFQASADSEVSLGSLSRSAAYEENMQAADPFPVFVTEKDSNDPQGQDLVRTTYQWKAELQRYVVTGSELLKSEEIQTAQLQVLFRGRVADVENTLAGAWVRRSGNQRQVLFFDPSSRSVRIIEGELLEGHIWTSSLKTGGSSRLLVYMANEAFTSIKSIMGITFRDMDTILVSIQDRPDWDATFVRLDSQGALTIAKNTRDRIVVYPFLPQGNFRGIDGTELIFTGYQIIRRKGNIKEEGVFVTFTLDKPIVTMAFLNDQGLIEDVEDYMVTSSLLDAAKPGEAYLDLQPVKLFMNRIEPENVDPSRFINEDS